MIILGMAWDFLGIPGTTWVTLRPRLPGSPWGFLGLWESWGLPGNPRESPRLRGNPRDVLGILWTPKISRPR